MLVVFANFIFFLQSSSTQTALLAHGHTQRPFATKKEN